MVNIQNNCQLKNSQATYTLMALNFNNHEYEYNLSFLRLYIINY